MQECSLKKILYIKLYAVKSFFHNILPNFPMNDILNINHTKSYIFGILIFNIPWIRTRDNIW